MAGAEHLQSLGRFEFSYIKIEGLIYYLEYNLIYTPLPILPVRDLGQQSFCSQVSTDGEEAQWFLPYSSVPQFICTASAVSSESSC